MVDTEDFMKRLILLLVVLLVPTMAVAQTVTITFAWDASLSGPGPVDNPVKYKLYKCTDVAATLCTSADAGIALTLAQSVATGTTYWYATAYQNGIIADGVPMGILESGKSNVLKLIVNVPPGNPKNAKVRSYTTP